MAPKAKNRVLYIQKYLMQQTDEEHPATTADIAAYLKAQGISAGRKTIKLASALKGVNFHWELFTLIPPRADLHKGVIEGFL